MSRLIRLHQDDEGIITLNGRMLNARNLERRGKLKTLVVQNPHLSIESEIEQMASRNSAFIPPRSMAYTASEFNPDTQHIRGNHAYAVYAIQFYDLFGIRE